MQGAVSWVHQWLWVPGVLQAQSVAKFMCCNHVQIETCNYIKRMYLNTSNHRGFSSPSMCLVHSNSFSRNMHLFVLLSSAQRHRSACPLQGLLLDQKHEPKCLWVHQMEISHHVLIIQTKHEIETTKKTIFFHAKRKLQTSVYFMKWFCQVQCMLVRS